jgi:hypothetical protein
MAALDEGFVPQLLGSRLATRTGNFQARRAVAPISVHDFDATRGRQVQLDRFQTFGERGLSKQQRSRNKSQIIGTNNTESLGKSTHLVTLTEFTGPSTTTGEAACLHLTDEDMRYARHLLWQFYQQGEHELGLERFHESIGSMALADDFARFDDRALVEELARSIFRYNPSARTDTNVLATDRFATSDLRLVAEQLATLNTPRFPDGFYHGLISERMMRHLREDPLFQQFAIALVQGSNPLQMSPVVTNPAGQGQMATGMGPRPDTNPLPPVYYEGFLLFPTNTLPTRLIATAGGNRLASLGYFFGPGSVGVAGGRSGPRVYANDNTDYKRHWFYIWRMFGQYEYLLDDNEFSGCAIEARTYAP